MNFRIVDIFTNRFAKLSGTEQTAARIMHFGWSGND